MAEDDDDCTAGVAGTAGVIADTLRRLGGGRGVVCWGCGYGSMAPWALCGVFLEFLSLRWSKEESKMCQKAQANRCLSCKQEFTPDSTHEADNGFGSKALKAITPQERCARA